MILDELDHCHDKSINEDGYDVTVHYRSEFRICFPTKWRKSLLIKFIISCCSLKDRETRKIPGTVLCD